MPSLQYSVLLVTDMSDKKSPPRKEKPLFVKTPQSDGKGLKRKIFMPGSPPDDDGKELWLDDKKITPKRKRGLSLEGSPTQAPVTTPKTPNVYSNVSRSVPLSERQQLALIMRMTDESAPAEALPKPLSPQTPTSVTKKTPSDKRLHKRNDRGETTLHLAAIRGDVKQIKKLIKAGADVNIKDFAGWTPLHEACSRGWILAAKQLLKCGAHVNVQGLDDDTPLHDASVNGHKKLVELLLKNGANPLQQNSQGKSAIDVAFNPDVERLLRKEIISSSSDSSSIDDVRSPTSPESIASQKDEDSKQDMEELINWSAKEIGPSSRRVLIPKGPKEFASPRLVFKFQREQKHEVSDKPMDSQEPQYKSYSVTLETGDKSQGFDLDSPVSSADSDLYDPQFDSANNLGRSTAECSSMPNAKNNVEKVLPLDSSLPLLQGSNSLSETEEESRGSDMEKLHLKPLDTQPFIPHFEDISDTEEDTSDIKPPQEELVEPREDSVHIPQSDSNHTRLKEAEVAPVTLEIIQNVHPPVSPVSVTELVEANSSQGTSANTSTEQGPLSQGLDSATDSHRQSGSNSGFSELCKQERTFKRELRSSSPFKLDEGSNHSQKLGNSRTSSPVPQEKESRASSPKLDRESRPSSPKVPPLKIIIPPKASTSSSSSDSDCLKTLVSKPALPYVLNPTQEQEVAGGKPLGEPITISQDTSRASSPGSSRPSSRGSATVVTRSELKKEQQAPPQDNVVSKQTTSQENNIVQVQEIEKEGETTSVKSGKSSKDKEKEETKEEKEITQRVTRSSARSQQQQTNTKQENVKQEKGDSLQLLETASTSKTNRSEEEDAHVHPRKRKLRPKPDSSVQSVEVTRPVPVAPEKPEKTPNPYEMYLTMRRQAAMRREKMTTVYPKAPQGFKDYLMVTCSYVIQGKAASTISVPTLSPPNSVTGPMRDLFIEQEKARYQLRLQHLIEREKLILSKEHEIIREHGRAARALANQSLPLSVCTVLRDEEIYNMVDPDQREEKEKNVRSRYNGRQFFSWLADVDEKFDKIKESLILRHHHEAESLYAVQKLDWEWKLKELGLCDYNNTPVIDELHVPMVQVSNEFDLLPG